VGAVLVRIAIVDRSLWFDELITVIKANQTLPSLLEGLADDVHPPLYYVLLHLWVSAVGDTPAAIRSLSIAWSVVAVLAVWAWSREAFPHRSALPAAAIVAFAPFSAWYATEARMYAMLLALTALAGWLAWRTLSRGPERLTVGALFAVLVAMALTHYFASLFIAALGLLAVVLFAARPALRPAAAWLVAGCTAGIVSLLPWVAFVAEHRSWGSPQPTIYPQPDAFSVLIAGLEMVVGFHSFKSLGLIAAGWPLLGLLALMMLPRMGRVGWRCAGVLLVAVVPVAVLLLASILGPRPVFDPRFLAVSAIPLYLLLGQLVLGASRRVAVGAAVLAIGLAVALTQQEAGDAENPKLYDFAGAVQTINRRADPGDTVMLLPNFSAAGHLADPVFSYYPPNDGLHVADTSRIGQVSPGATHEAIRQAWMDVERWRPRRVYVIDSFAESPRARAAADAARTFLRHRARQVERIPFPNAEVRVYAPRWKRRA
jgi:uncharacterized membrane protein